MPRIARVSAVGHHRRVPTSELLEGRQMLSAVLHSADHDAAAHLNSRLTAQVHHGHKGSVLAARIARPAARVQNLLPAEHGRSKPDLLPREITAISTPLAVGGPATNAYIPAQIRKAYGFDQLANQGRGLTIAIVDAYDDPNIASDLSVFSAQFGLPQMDGQNGDPTFTKAFPQGMPEPNTSWGGEISLDVEWVHALAPMANILLVETIDNLDGHLYMDANSGVNFAKAQAGVVVVSNSYGSSEFSGETAFDPNFLPLPGHPVAITYGSGDNGAAGRYPAASPNVLAVGGTSLATLSASGRYGIESAWSNGGGGPSQYEPRPVFQNGLPYGNTRTFPDVAFDANPSTGVAVYNTFSQNGWTRVGGNSFASPAWAAIIALADQSRIANGLPALTTAELHTALYTDYASANYANDFHDITTGNNGYPAGPGYDLVTGIGTPKVQNLVPTLAAAP